MEHPGIIQPTFRSLSSSSGVESDVEEEEVDQLDSDTEEEAPPPAAGPTAPPTKTRPKVQVERVPGKSFIPLSKIETLLQADGASRTRSTLHYPYTSAGEESFMSKEAVFAVAVATVSPRIPSTSILLTQRFPPLGRVREAFNGGWTPFSAVFKEGNGEL